MIANNSTAMRRHSHPDVSPSPLATAHHFPAALSINGRQSCVQGPSERQIR